MPFPLLPTGRRLMVMYESFFGMEHTPFVRDGLQINSTNRMLSAKRSDVLLM